MVLPTTTTAYISIAFHIFLSQIEHTSAVHATAATLVCPGPTAAEAAAAAAPRSSAFLLRASLAVAVPRPDQPEPTLSPSVRDGL